MLFLALFLLHISAIQYRGSLHSGGSEIRLPFPAYIVLALDPLVALSNALATHALYRAML